MNGFNAAVEQDRARADALLAVLRAINPVPGAQRIAEFYSRPIAAAYNATLGHPSLQPGGAVHGATLNLPPIGPLAIAKGAGAIPTILRAPGTGLTGGTARTFPALELPTHRLLRMARSIAKSEQDMPDVFQSGVETGLKKMQKTPQSGLDFLKAARGGMKHWRPSGTRGVGAAVKDKRLVERVEAQVGDKGHDVWVEKLQQMDPDGKWTLEKLRRVQRNVAERQGRRLGLGEAEDVVAPGNPAQRLEALEEYKKRARKPISEAAARLIAEDVKKPAGKKGFQKGHTLTPKPRQISGGGGGEADFPGTSPEAVFQTPVRSERGDVLPPIRDLYDFMEMPGQPSYAARLASARPPAPTALDRAMAQLDPLSAAHKGFVFTGRPRSVVQHSLRNTGLDADLLRDEPRSTRPGKVLPGSPLSATEGANRAARESPLVQLRRLQDLFTRLWVTQGRN
jgi:hypothetical protein